MPKGNNGFIKLYRNIMDWGWYSESNTARLFIHCILKANYTEKEWQSVKIPVGSFVTSYAKLAQELKLSKKEIRTALNHLISSHEVAYQSTTRYSIITVNNYITYQTPDTQSDTQRAHFGHTKGTRWATTNKRKKGRKEEYNFSKKEILKELKEEYERKHNL